MNKILLTLFLLILSPACFANIVLDDFAKTTLVGSSVPETNLKYNYSGTEKLPVKMKLIKDYGSEKDVYEGQNLELVVVKDVVHNNQIVIKKGTKASAEVNILISTGMNGIPASIILNNIKIDGIDSKKLIDNYELFGQDRSLIVFPLKWVLTILPPTGSFTNLIMGGHARLKPRKTMTIYYYPEWE